MVALSSIRSGISPLLRRSLRLLAVASASSPTISSALSRLVLFVVDWATNYVDPNNVEFNPGVYSGALYSFFPASGTVIANGIVGYQRRRKPGVGS